MSDSIFDRIKTCFANIKKNRKIQYFLLFIFIVILVFTLFFSKNTNEKAVKVQTDEVTLYVENLEKRLSSTLSKISGAGDVSVMITVESGKETVLATKIITTQNSNGTIVEETPVLVNGKTVVLKEMFPKIIGVLIVASGADNIVTRSNLQNATLSLLDIELNQIEILTRK